MLKRIFAIIAILLLVVLGWNFGQEYLLMHGYYTKMLASSQNRTLICWGLLFAGIPTSYLIYVKKKSIWTVITSIFIGLFLFTATYISIKSDLYGGTIKLLFNTLFLFALAIYTFIGFMALGERVKQSVLGLKTNKIFDVLLSLGLGLVLFILLNYVLILTTLFYTGISWAIYVGMGVLVRWQKERMQHIWSIIHDTLGIFSGGSEKSICSLGGLLRIIAIVLLLISFWYLFNGFQLAYLPYPTAWDANHAYMFFPKMWALNHGYYRYEPGMATGPHMRYAYIAYWFSLFSTTGFMGISADTIAIQMNFWSGILVLLFGLGLVSQIIEFLSVWAKRRDIEILDTSRSVVFLIGWFLLLLWMTSGMGAFLLFIDNKTDMGVLALIILALYSGFVFLTRILNDEENEKNASKKHYRYIGMSGFFYAMAAGAKPTALFDVVNFALFLRGIWFGWIGIVGVALIVIIVMAKIDFRGIRGYLSSPTGLSFYVPIALGGLGIGYDTLRIYMRKSVVYMRYFIVRGGIFLLSLLCIKVPFQATKAIINDTDISIGQFIKTSLLSYTPSISQDDDTNSGLTLHHRIPLLAQSGGPVAATCTLASQGMVDVTQLYEKTKKAPGNSYDEDVGRYVGFGWKGNPTTDARRRIKPFINPWWASYMDDGCYGFNPLAGSTRDAVTLCEHMLEWKTFDKVGLDTVLTKLSDESIYKDISIKERITVLRDAVAQGATSEQLTATYAPDINALDAYMQENTMYIETQLEGDIHVYIPYRFMNPLNISFNWSLQNLSSYYTDIGIVRLMLFVFMFVGLFYSIFSRYYVLGVINLVTLFGRILWWFIGGGILRYAIGLVIWTIISFLFFIWYLLADTDMTERVLVYIFIGLFTIFGLFQLVLNMTRISSQGGGGAFLWYKTNFGPTEVFNENLQRTAKPARGFGADNVFDMQFRHYKKFITVQNESSDDEGALIAGTYARYFVENQTHVKYDQFLTRLWEMFSDGDICNSYLRLQDNHIKHIVIDPNIGTVVQGAGNQTLFDRFFARVNATNNTIIEDGSMTMLIKLASAGHVRYVSSNNLGAKYAFIMPDSVFAGVTGDALILMKSRMALARFFAGNTGIISNIIQIAEQRVQDGTFVSDLADMLGLDINEQKVVTILRKGQISAADITGLTQDERKALSQYLSIKQLSPEELTKQLQSIVTNSIKGGNQIIVLEVQ